MGEEMPAEKLKLAQNDGELEEDEENETIDQQFTVMTEELEVDSTGGNEFEDEEDDIDMEEEDEEEDNGEETEDFDGQSNPQNIFQVKEFTDLLLHNFTDGSIKEGDLKDSINFSETCVQQMFDNEEDCTDDGPIDSSEAQSDMNDTTHHDQIDSSENQSSFNDSNENPLKNNVGESQNNGEAILSFDENRQDHQMDIAPPSVENHTGDPAAGGPRKRGRKRKKGVSDLHGKKKSRTNVEGGDDGGNEFPSYLLTCDLPETDIEQLKVGYQILQHLTYQISSSYFLNEPDMTEIEDRIEYDQVIEEPMWLMLVEKNFCKGMYKDIGALFRDIRLILENCYRFWTSRNEVIVEMAFALEECLEERIALLPEEVQKKVCLEATHGHLEDESQWDSIANEINSSHFQHIRSKSKLFRLVELSNLKPKDDNFEEKRRAEKETVESNIIDFENVVVLSDADTIETVNCMWELADIGHFLCLVHALLHVPQPTQLEVERMFLVPRSSNMLATLMTSLLVRPMSRFKLDKGPPMPYSMWTKRLCTKVSEWYKVYHNKCGHVIQVFESIGIDPHFWNILGTEFNPLENFDFTDLQYFQRVWLFKALCGYVLHNHKSMTDLFNTLPKDKLIVPPFGEDKRGHRYFYHPHFLDVRIYKQSVSKYTMKSIEADIPPYNPVSTPPSEREMFFPKEKFLPLKRPNKLSVLANSVQGVQILASEFKASREKEELVSKLREIHQSLELKEPLIEYNTNKVRFKMYDEYNKFINRPENYEDPDLNYWNFNIKVIEKSIEVYGNEPNQNGLETDPVDDSLLGANEELGPRRSRRETHLISNVIQSPISDLDSEESSAGSDDREDQEDSGDDWAPKDSKKKKQIVFRKPNSLADEKIKPASEDDDAREGESLETMRVKSPDLTTPEPSPIKTEMMDELFIAPEMEDPLSVVSMKRELFENEHSDQPSPSAGSPTPTPTPTETSHLELSPQPVTEQVVEPPSRPLIKVKNNLVREDFQEAASMLTLPQMTPQEPLNLPPPNVDPLQAPPPSKVKSENADDDDEIEFLGEKVITPRAPPPQPGGDNSIVKIGNMIYKLGSTLPPGTMLPRGVPPGPGMLVPLIQNNGRMISQGRGGGQPPMGQQLVIQNSRSLNPLMMNNTRTRMRGRPGVNAVQSGTPRGYLRNPAPGGFTNMSPRASPRGGSPRANMLIRSPLQRHPGGGYNLTPRKIQPTPPPIPRQLLNRNISVSLVEPKPAPTLPKLSGVTITPTKPKPSPAKTLIFNSPSTPKALMMSPAAPKTQMVDASVQLQFRADGSTSYAIELGNNQTHELSKEQVNFFKNKHNGTMPSIVRISVPVDIARRVKPPCITL